MAIYDEYGHIPEGMVRDSRKRKLLIWASAREVWKWKVLFYRKRKLSSGRQLGRCGSGRYCFRAC